MWCSAYPPVMAANPTKANQGEWVRLQEELSYLQAVNRDVTAANPKVTAVPVTHATK